MIEPSISSSMTDGMTGLPIMSLIFWFIGAAASRWGLSAISCSCCEKRICISLGALRRPIGS